MMRSRAVWLVLGVIGTTACGDGVGSDDAGGASLDARAPMDVTHFDEDGDLRPDARAFDTFFFSEEGNRDTSLPPDAARADDAFVSCSSEPPSYACGATEPCTGGTCISSWCLGPDRDPERWASCGDGTCSPCETDRCGIDCGGPTRTASPTFDPSSTITLKLHGLAVSTEGRIEDRVYGAAIAESDLEATLRVFEPGLPSGLTDPSAPNQLVAAEFYGRTAAAWMSPEQVAEVESLSDEGPEALHRYALIVAMFLRDRLSRSGATHVAIACHSMGCHVTRYLVEHDLLGLASEGRIARIVLMAGVVNGAGMSELFDNPSLRAYAESAPIRTTDFVHMHPEFVRDETAIWDHRLREANNPMWAGMILHTITGTDPAIAGSTGLLRPLEIINPGSLANDAILFDQDTFFTSMAASNQLLTTGGARLSPGHTFVDANHPSVEPNDGAAATAAAMLFHHRRVTITLRSVTLHDDHERHGGFDPTTFGAPPADLVPEVDVRFDRYTMPTFGRAALVSTQSLSARSAAFFQMEEDETRDADVVLFDGPVFDAQTELDLTLAIREVDSYPRYGITELPSGDGSVLASFDGAVAIADGELTLSSEDLDAVVEVRVHTLY
ncbi:MAG: hypothetical protein J0L92_12875 [Deltaproteobacteria bacterium]|nr:hypothetical protein [Deltaproteobacteria bacterium]